MARNSAVITGQTPARPSQLTLTSKLAAQPPADEAHHEQLAHDEHPERPVRQQIEVPAHDDAGDHQQAVDERVEQRAEARVLARQARGDAVEVVRPPDHREDHERPDVGPVVGVEGQHQEDGQQREPQEADRVRDRPRPPRLARERLGRRRTRAVEPRRGGGRSAARCSAASCICSRARSAPLLGVRPGSATAQPPRRAAPSSGSERDSWPRRTCASSSPEASERLPAVSRSGQPSSSASANLPPGPTSSRSS